MGWGASKKVFQRRQFYAETTRMKKSKPHKELAKEHPEEKEPRDLRGKQQNHYINIVYYNEA